MNSPVTPFLDCRPQESEPSRPYRGGSLAMENLKELPYE